MANQTNKSHHFWVVEERYKSGPDDSEWRPTGDETGGYRLYGTRQWARLWKKTDYVADPKNLRVRKYVREG